MKLIIQEIEDMDISKVKIVAQVRLDGKVLHTVEVDGLRDTGKMVDFTSSDECMRMLSCHRKFKNAIGVLNDRYYTQNVLLAYSEKHLKDELKRVERAYLEYVDERINSYQQLRNKFISTDWKGRD